jgi:hypothetical protein
MLAGMSVRVLLAGLLCLLLLAGCGDDNRDGGDVVEGTGFELTVPDGWRDRTGSAEDFQFAGFEPDVILTGDAEDGFQANINVVRESDAAVSDLDEYLEAARKLVRGGSVAGEEIPGGGAELGPAQRTERGGDDAREFGHTREVEGRELELRQRVAIRDGAAYTITYTALAERFDDDLDAYEAAVDSWRWR